MVVQLVEAFKLGVEAVELHRDLPEPPRNAQDGIFQGDVLMKELKASFS